MVKGIIMVDTNLLNLWEAADALDIESWRLSRLGRYLRMDPADKRIPAAEVQRFSELEDAERRYAALRTWLLDTLPGQGGR
jgi:hypothetical protein